MSIGELTSQAPFSTLKYTGAPITATLSTTQTNQELIILEAEGSTIENVKVANLNSLTLTAGSADLHFSVLTRERDIESHVFIGDPVFVCDAGTTINLSGLNIVALKFANNSGAEYLLQGFSW